MFNRLRKYILNFISNNNNDSDNWFPYVAALGAGLYPLIHLYNYNFTLMNSWSQFIFFLMFFLVVPLAVFKLLHNLFYRIESLFNYKKYLIPFLNYSFFACFLVITTYAFHKKWLILSVLVGLVFTLIMYRHIRKIIVFQILLALLGFTRLMPDFHRYYSYSKEWMKPEDNIELVKFKKHPNIYFIQPDGYVNFTQLKTGYYNFNNSEFKDFLVVNDFKIYDDFRSNYYSTLSSNSSMFAMKHHYYNNTQFSNREVYAAREVIAGDNPAVSILKSNNYKTFLLLEYSYLLLNRPKLYYDYCNIDFNEVSFFGDGFKHQRDIKEDLKQVIKENTETNNFYFIEKLTPGHIHNPGFLEEGDNREIYLKGIKETNRWLKEVVNFILNNDDDSIIIIAADHGGFVGFDNTIESFERVTDEKLVNSIFSSILAVKWSDSVPKFNKKPKTPINLFRFLYSYLSEDIGYLEYLQEDKSFIQINKGATPGVYEYINENGDVVFNRISN